MERASSLPSRVSGLLAACLLTSLAAACGGSDTDSGGGDVAGGATAGGSSAGGAGQGGAPVGGHAGTTGGKGGTTGGQGGTTGGKGGAAGGTTGGKGGAAGTGGQPATCSPACPAGSSCQQGVCHPDGGQLGATCSKNGDCASALCLESGHCSKSCTAAADCPPGPQWTCGPLPQVGMICQCQGGALDAQVEQCDGQDNNCDGIVDNGALCGQAGFTCQKGVCACPAENMCSGQCFDLQTDPKNCGKCGTTCASGATCEASKCTCPDGQQVCQGACLDTTKDPKNCGTCGKVCPTDASCQDGTCGCQGGSAVCGDACVQEQVDVENCGSCGHACPGGWECQQGQCACPFGTTACGVACLDVSLDNDNCGGCGIKCTGTCTGGRCLITLASGIIPQAIAVDATSVYWTRWDGSGCSVVKVPLGGGTPTTIVNPQTDLGQCTSIAVNSTNVYWTNAYHQTVLTAPLDGGDPTVVASNQNMPSGIALDANSIYWGAKGALDNFWHIRKAALAGGGGEELASAGYWGQSPLEISVDAKNVYWPGFSVPVGGGDPVVVFGDTVYGFAIDATSIYFTSTYGRLEKNPLGGGMATMLTPFSGQTNFITYAIAVDNESVYYATESGVMKVPVGGGDQTLLASSTADRLVVDATSIYWIDSLHYKVFQLTPK